MITYKVAGRRGVITYKVAGRRGVITYKVAGCDNLQSGRV